MAMYPPQYGNVTIGNGGAGSSTISITGAGTGYNNSVLTATGTGASTWANNTGAKLTTKGQMHLEGEDADIVMNGASLKEILNGITDRLSILQPKPELLAKYENLRQAYEHYKTLEALLHEDNNGQ
jgi:hypothetical protein